MKLVLGLGITGFSIAQFLAQQGADFKVADSRQKPTLLPEFSANFPLIEVSTGVWQLSLLDEVDEIFISPGIAQNEQIVAWAREKDIEITSDIELFSRYAQAPVVGITGTNGKSTVTQLLGTMARASGKKVAIGGNIGKPALDCLHDDIELYVLELSSYQLDYTKKLKLFTGVVLNITPDHLDRYASFEHYKASKLSLYQYCQNSVINIDDSLIPKKASAVHFGLEIPKSSQNFGTVTCHESCYFLKGDDVLLGVDDIQLIGEHNISNILAALALGEQIGLDMQAMTECIKTFKGLAHRLEWIAHKQGVEFYNDSKATNVRSSVTALKALISKHKNIVLIAGGAIKDEDYAPLFELIDKEVLGVVLIGQSAAEFDQGICNTQTIHAKNMLEATTLAQAMIDDGAVVLSPGCASFDMFDNFEHRGDAFKQAVLSL
ncbi:UDP-N-acetylmuramoyl-L-alanine--D-glutamate ligase [Candidatus Thioglobus sp.]|uniref:UDP-N-acetylmuramoyl-L-alanine--D-glutamate ligase n=1 Tax=Candidatus Thioglobus sp. TaxID=2026721 RepID=UPI003D0F5813